MFKKIWYFCVSGLLVVILGCAPYNTSLGTQVAKEEKPTVDLKAQAASLLNLIQIQSSRESCKGPYGIDSQKILSDGWGNPEYMIGIVSDIDLEKNNDGTWYVHKCMLASYLITPLTFASPYPQQYDLKEGDFIGFKGDLQPIRAGGKNYRTYHSVKILDYISSQSANCQVIAGFPTPSKNVSFLGVRGEKFAMVTGIVMAVQTQKNSNPEPENPSNYYIVTAVMKFADGKLYIVDFPSSIFVQDSVPNSQLLKIDRVDTPHLSQDAFGEGDVVTVIQTSSTLEQRGRITVEHQGFSAIYLASLNTHLNTQ